MEGVGPEGEAAVESLLGSFEPTARKIFARYGVPAQDAEDVLQETFLAFLAKRDEVRSPAAWLAGTLRNRCLLYHRSHRRRLYNAVDSAILETVAETGPSAQERSDLRSDLRRATRGLSDRCRSLLRLRYGAGCTPQEAAARLGYRKWAVYKATERCLAALTRRLALGDGSRGKALA